MNDSIKSYLIITFGIMWGILVLTGFGSMMWCGWMCYIPHGMYIWLAMFIAGPIFYLALRKFVFIGNSDKP